MFSGHMPLPRPWACCVLPGVPRLMGPGRDIFLDLAASSLRQVRVVAAVLEPLPRGLCPRPHLWPVRQKPELGCGLGKLLPSTGSVLCGVSLPIRFSGCRAPPQASRLCLGWLRAGLGEGERCWSHQMLSRVSTLALSGVAFVTLNASCGSRTLG